MANAKRKDVGDVMRLTDDSQGLRTGASSGRERVSVRGERVQRLGKMKRD